MLSPQAGTALAKGMNSKPGLPAVGQLPPGTACPHPILPSGSWGTAGTAPIIDTTTADGSTSLSHPLAPHSAPD